MRTSEARSFLWMWRARKRPIYPRPPTMSTVGLSAMVSLRRKVGLSRSMRCDAGERRRGQESKGGGLSLLEMRLRFSLYWVPRSVCRV